jgi:hypothetical protein
MSFANPLMLFALAAAAVPILIHLINRRRPRRQQFAAIEFILRSVERVERRWRLRRFLLLAARVTLLAAVAFAAARPLFGEDAKSHGVASGPERLAIVIDTSLSMRARPAGSGETMFERAKAAAKRLVSDMGAEDRATIVSAALEPLVLLPQPTASRTELLAALDKVAPTFEHGDIADAVTLAARALSSSSPEGAAAPADAPGGLDRPPARIVVLSDLAGHALRSAADLTVDGSGTAELEVMDLFSDLEPESRSNRGVVGLTVTNIPGNAPRTVEAKAKIRSFAADKGDAVPTDVVLRTGDQELTGGSADIPPSGAVDKALVHAFPDPGFVPITIALPPDTLAEDDARHAVADVRRSVRTLVVDGAPSGLPKEDEVYYLEAALAAGAQDQPPPRVITPDDLSREDLEGVYDVIILAGVTAFSPADGPRLVSFVENGGGLWITAALGMDIELYNSELTRILPRPFRGIRALEGDEISGGAGVESFASPLLTHPVLSLFQGDALSGLVSAETRAYLLLERDRDKPAEVLLSYEDGQPALVEAQRGRGRVVVLTTSIDRDLGDLPIRPGFLPLVRRLILHLGGALERPPQREVLVREPRTISIPQGAVAVEVISPDGKSTRWTQADLSGAGEVKFEKTEVPGHYQIRVSYAASAEPVSAEGFAVNVDPRESDLRALSADEATAILMGTAAPGEEQDRVASVARLRVDGFTSPDAIAALLLVLMLAAFILESALTAQRPG